MALVRIASITLRIKGHHVFQHNYKVGEEFVCPGDNVIVIKTKVEDAGKKEAVVGHIPDPLAQTLGPMLKDGTIHSITTKITGEKQGAPEGVWFRVVGSNFLANTFSMDRRNSRCE